MTQPPVLVIGSLAKAAADVSQAMQGEGGSIIKSAMTPTKLVPALQAQVDQLYTLDDVDVVGRHEGIIYGPPGSGKTVVAATFPPPFRWLAADGHTSLKSIKWAMKRGLTSFTDPKAVVAYSPSEVVRGRYIEKAQAFNLMQDMIDYWFKPDQVGSWETLVIDSFTEVNDWAIDLGLGLNNTLPTSSKPLSKSDEINRKAMVRLITGEQDYKSAMGLIQGWLRNVRVEAARHNKNLILICHEWQETKENDDGTQLVTQVKPLLIGQLRSKISKDVDDVWHMERYNKGTGIEVKVRVHGDNKTDAKTRWGDALPREVEPDYRKMVEVVKAFHAKAA